MTAVVTCKKCRRPLRDPVSRKRRYGPDCWDAVRTPDDTPARGFPVKPPRLAQGGPAMTGQQELPLEPEETPLPELPMHTPEEWSEMYGLRVMDPDGWRVPGAPAWTDPVVLAEFYHRALESTTDGLFSGAFSRIRADLDAQVAS